MMTRRAAVHQDAQEQPAHDARAVEVEEPAGPAGRFSEPAFDGEQEQGERDMDAGEIPRSSASLPEERSARARRRRTTRATSWMAQG